MIRYGLTTLAPWAGIPFGYRLVPFGYIDGYLSSIRVVTDAEGNDYIEIEIGGNATSGNALIVEQSELLANGYELLDNVEAGGVPLYGSAVSVLLVDCYASLGSGEAIVGHSGLQLATINHYDAAAERYLISDDGLIEYRTASEVLTDIGAAAASHVHAASDITSGTLSTDRYSAYADLTAEGYLNNDADTDILIRGQSDSRYQALDADLTAIAGITCARGMLITGQGGAPAWAGLALGSNGQFLKSNGLDVVWAAHGLTHSDVGAAAASHTHTAGDITSGTLSTDRYSAYADLTAEGYLDNNADTDILIRSQGDARYSLVSHNHNGVYQPIDAFLTSIAALGTAADRIIYTTGIDTAAEAPLTSFARTLLDDADAATARSTLGLSIGSNVQAWDADLDAIAALSTTGILCRIAANSWALRIVTSECGLTITNPGGVGGNINIGATTDTPRFSTIRINDSDASHYLEILTSSNLTANRQLTFITGDASRTITLNGNVVLNDWFDQSVKTTASPQFAGLTVGTLSGYVKASAGVLSGQTGVPHTDLTYSGLTAGHVLRASSATAASFAAIQDADLPATIVRTSRSISTTTPLSGGGDLSANRTISITGLSTIGSANQLVGVNASANAWEYKTLQGTANQISVSHSANAITLAAPQNIHTDATPQFARLGLGAAADGSASLRLNTVNNATGDILTITAGGLVSRRTPAQVLADIGAAASSHTHTAGDITSGTLAVARGGTGISSYTIGNYIRASGATTLEQRTPAQVLADIGGIGGSGSANHVAIWSGASTLTYANNQLYWDGTNNRLGVGVASPAAKLHVYSGASSATAPSGTLVTLENNNNTYLTFLGPTGDYYTGIQWKNTGSKYANILFNDNASRLWINYSDSCFVLMENSRMVLGAGTPLSNYWFDMRFESTSPIVFIKDDGKLRFGNTYNSPDAQIYSNGTHLVINPTSTNDVVFKGDVGVDFKFYSDYIANYAAQIVVHSDSSNRWIDFYLDSGSSELKNIVGIRRCSRGNGLFVNNDGSLTNPIIENIAYGNNAGYYGALNLGHSRGAVGAETYLNSSDQIGRINFIGRDGASLKTGGSIRAKADASWSGSGDCPTLIEIWACANSSDVENRCAYFGAGASWINNLYTDSLYVTGATQLRTIRQNNQPSGSDMIYDEVAFWIDTDDSNKLYLIYNQSGTYKKVLLT